MATDRDELAKKRAEVVGSNKNKNGKNFALMALTLLLVMAGYYLFMGKEPTVASPSLATSAVAAGAASGETERVYDPAQLADGKARYYDYTSTEGLRIRYFLVRDGAGKVHSAFDACDSCWPEGKGYSQDGGEMICNNCRMRFKVEKVGEVKGGCNPSPLKTTLRDGKLVVACSDLEGGKGLFNYKK